MLQFLWKLPQKRGRAEILVGLGRQYLCRRQASNSHTDTDIFFAGAISVRKTLLRFGSVRQEGFASNLRNDTMKRVTLGLMTVLLLGAVLPPGSAVAQNPSCAKSVDIAGPGLSTQYVYGSFVCVGSLDGASVQQIIVGDMFGGSGFVFILENTGTIRKKICWSGGTPTCPTFIVQ
jgi:hypothetical protein